MSNSRRMLKETLKRHIPQRHLSSLRIMYRIGMETIYGLKRTGFMNIAIIAAMAAILTIFGVLFRFTLSLSTIANELGNVLEISVYLKSGVSPAIVKDRINEIKHVQHLE